MQETRVWSLVQEDPTCREATQPLQPHYWACGLEPESRNYWALVWQLLKPLHPRARAPLQEKLPQWEVHAPQLESSLLGATREKAQAAMKTQHGQN